MDRTFNQTYMSPPVLVNVDNPKLFQEQLYDQISDRDHLMWHMAVGCAVISRSTRKHAFPVMNTIFTRWTPHRIVSAYEKYSLYWELESDLRPSGLQNIKATRILSLSYDWTKGMNYDKLIGAGDYFKQSFEIFALKLRPRMVVTDSHLKAYLCAHDKELS